MMNSLAFALGCAIVVTAFGILLEKHYHSRGNVRLVVISATLGGLILITAFAMTLG